MFLPYFIPLFEKEEQREILPIFIYAVAEISMVPAKP